MSFRVAYQKYIDNYTIVQTVESCIVQEVLLVNNGTEVWPETTCLKLTEANETDVELLPMIKLLSEIPSGSQVMISIKIDVSSSTRVFHHFSYQLCFENATAAGLL